MAMACGLTVGCQQGSPGTAKADAHGKDASKVTGAVKEADLAKLQLTEQAEKRLGVEAVEAKKQPVPRAISYGGEAMIPPGRLISVASPFLGTVEAPPKAEVPLPGRRSSRASRSSWCGRSSRPRPALRSAPLLKEADGQVKAAQEQLKIQKTALERAQQLVDQKLMPQASLIDAKANHEVAVTNLHNAEARRDEILKIAGDPNAGGGMTTLTFRAPVKGILQNVHAQVGQPVPAGALLFDVAELDPIWVKVSVYVGDLERLALDKPAGIGSLADPPGVRVRPAKPVTAPPPATRWRRPSSSSTRSITRTASSAPGSASARPCRSRATRRAWPCPARP